MIFGLAWRMLGRELRSGEMRLLFVALCIAVAAVSAVGFLADRVGRALEHEARQMLGADLVVVSDQPPAAILLQEAAKRGLRTAQTIIFPSMVVAGDEAQLVEIKAVSSAYPLRGQLRTAPQPGEAGCCGRRRSAAPKTVWADERLYSTLGWHRLTPVNVGQLALPTSALLTREPDRSMNLFAMAPRLMMHIDDVPASGLIQFGARVRYRLLIAGPEQAVAEGATGPAAS
jgi:putative ABC transport system permease protein